MKSYEELISYLTEHVISDEDPPKWKEMDFDAKPELSTESNRFKIHVRPSGDTGVISIHHPKTGKHIGTISYNRAGKTAARITEMVKNPENKDSKMMNEAITHLHDKHGYSFFSSTTMTTHGHRVWEDLSKTHKIALYDKRKDPKKRLLSKDVIPSKKYQENCAPHEAGKEYLLHKFEK